MKMAKKWLFHENHENHQKSDEKVSFSDPIFSDFEPDSVPLLRSQILYLGFDLKNTKNPYFPCFSE